MKLRNKLLISQTIVFATMFFVLVNLLPDMIYWYSWDSETEMVMNFNNQIMMRIDSCFMELKRFSSVVTQDQKLNVLLNEYLNEPSEKNEARIRLYLSELPIRDHVPSYLVLGIYIDIKDGNKSYNFNSVGLANSVKKHIKEKVLPAYYSQKTDTMLVEPFPFPQGESETIFGGDFSMCYAYVNKYNKNGILGTVTIIPSFDKIIYIAEDVGNYSKDFLFLTENDVVIEPSVSNSQIDIEKTFKNLTYGSNYLEGYYRDLEGITTVRISECGNLKLISRLTKDDIIENNRSVIIQGGLLVAIFCICVLIIMIPIIEQFTKPLAEVSRQMDEIAKGNLEARVIIRTRDEIGEVGEAFNIMSKKLKDNINKLIEKEKIEQKMRYGLLISQVDPHFIYNTMNTITYLAQKGRNEDIIVVNKAMIEILKDRLRIEISEIYDTVEQEIKVVCQYLTIQEYRYEGTFKKKIEIDEDVKHCLIAKNILQPIVENALLHGILANKDENGEFLGGCITIKIKKQDDNLVIIIQDNGAGMSEETLNAIKDQSAVPIRGKHIGIRNVRERINYIYGEGKKTDIQSKKEEGTTVTLYLPILRKDDNKESNTIK